MLFFIIDLREAIRIMYQLLQFTININHLSYIILCSYLQLSILFLVFYLICQFFT